MAAGLRTTPLGVGVGAGAGVGVATAAAVSDAGSGVGSSLLQPTKTSMAAAKTKNGVIRRIIFVCLLQIS